jgi:hypothetical protein
MGANKPDDTIRIVDPDDDTVLVARDIEDDAAIAENTSAPDVSLDLCRLGPIRLSDLPEPGHYRLAGVGHTYPAI